MSHSGPAQALEAMRRVLPELQKLDRHKQRAAARRHQAIRQIQGQNILVVEIAVGHPGRGPYELMIDPKLISENGLDFRRGCRGGTLTLIEDSVEFIDGRAVPDKVSLKGFVL